MTTPRDDIAGLSERLRERAATRNTLTRVPDTDFATMGYYSAGSATLDREAATQLDSLLKEREALQARVKELEESRDLYAEHSMKEEDCRKMWQARALRAEQERDEAVAVLNPFMPDPTMMDLLWGDMDDEATGSHTIKLKHFRAARDLVRRLAGPEKA